MAVAGLTLVPTAQAQWLLDQAPAASLVPIDSVHERWLRAADDQVSDDVINATLAYIHRVIRRKGKSKLRAAPERERPEGFAGMRLSVSRQRLRLTFRYRF